MNNPSPSLFGLLNPRFAAARAPFNLYAHYGMFSLLDEKDVYVMGHCPVRQFKVKPQNLNQTTRYI